ncbi:MAG: hypothetical protein MUE81_21920, partial [Thermoflexibacter sp.]|nr:hypothetical protein [Thermoflexibacter sp.]
MKKLLFVLLISFLSLYIFSAFTFFNDDWKKVLLARLQEFYQKQPKENAYLHTDKTQYVAGETIWFKAYLQNELAHIELSKTLYVELINEENQLVQRLQLSVNQFSTHGNFDLADSINDGNYRIRAYTNYMRNWDTEAFFEKNIQIINHNKQKTTVFPKLSADIDIQFFPEGGDLVYDLPNKLGFKAVDTNGEGVLVEGEVWDSEGVKSATFKSNEMGIGSFKLNPVGGRAYKATVRWANQSKTITVAMPRILPQGYVMNIEHLPNEKLRLKVYCSLPQKNFWIIAQSKGKVFYTHSDSLISSVFIEDIPKEIFPDGLVQFTLFDAQGIPHAERLVHIRFSPTILLNIGKNKQNYKPREKIELTIFAQDIDSKAIEGDFSLAVIDAEKINPISEEDNLLSYFGLTAELKGKIENPTYYLKNTPESNKALNDLLLTQGWRRFQWKDLINNDLPPISYFIEQGIPISGNVKSQDDRLLKSKSISLINPQKGIYANADIDENGNFQTNDLYFMDSAEILFNVEDEKNIKVELQGKKYPPIPPYQSINAFFEIDTVLAKHSKRQQEIEQVFKLSNNTMLLKEVTVKGKKIEDDILEIKTLKLVNVATTIQGEALSKNANASMNPLSGIVGKIAGLRMIVAP